MSASIMEAFDRAQAVGDQLKDERNVVQPGQLEGALPVGVPYQEFEEAVEKWAQHAWAQAVRDRPPAVLLLRGVIAIAFLAGAIWQAGQDV